MTSNQHWVTGNTPTTAPENRVFYPALDGFRAIAFLLVFFQHYEGLPWGWTGVNFFFVLSGFLITGILYDTRDAPHHARNFYIRRSLRIFPLYYGIFVALLLLNPFVHWHWSLVWLAWPLYIGNFLRFLLPQSPVLHSAQEEAADGHLSSQRFPRSELYLGHFWSLCVEEQFYLVWPWIVFRLRNFRALLWICAATVILMPFARILVQARAPLWMVDQQLVYRTLPFQLDALLLGGLIALLWRSQYRQQLQALARLLTPIAFLAVGSYLVLTVRYPNLVLQALYPYPTWTYTFGLTAVDILAALSILSALRPGTLLYRLLSLPPLRWLGRISYGAYVFHDISHALFVHIVTTLSARSLFVAQHALLVLIAMGFSSTLLLSWLSFRFFESRFLGLKDRWTTA